MPEDELRVMAAIVRQVQAAIGPRGLRLTERQQAQVLYYVIDGLQRALKAEAPRWQ